MGPLVKKMGRSAVAAAVAGTILTVVVLRSASLGGPCTDLHHHQQQHQQHREQQEHLQEQQVVHGGAAQEDLLLVMLRRLRRGRGESGGEGDVKDSGSPSSSSAGLHAPGGGGGGRGPAQDQPEHGADIHGQRHRRVAGTVAAVKRDVDPSCSRSVVNEEAAAAAQEERSREDPDSGAASPPAAELSCGARLPHLPRTFVADIFSFLASTSPPSDACGRPGSCGASVRPFALPRPPCAKQESWSDGAMEASLRTWEAFAFAAPSGIVASSPPPVEEEEEEQEKVERERPPPTAGPKCGGDESSANCSQANARRRRRGHGDQEEAAEEHRAKRSEGEDEAEKVMAAEFRRALEQWAAEGSEGRPGGADASDDGPSVSRDAGGGGGDEQGGESDRGGAGGARRSHDPLREVVRSLRERRAASPGAEWPSGLEALMDRTLVLLLRQLIDTPPMKDPGGGATHFGRLLRHYLNRDDAAGAPRDELRARPREARRAQWPGALGGEEGARAGGQTHGKVTKFLVLKAMQAVCEQWSAKKPRSVDAVNDGRNVSAAAAGGGYDTGGQFNVCAGCRLRDQSACVCLVYKRHVVEPKRANIRDCAGKCLPTAGCLNVYSNHTRLLMNEQGTRQALCVPVHYSGLKMLFTDNSSCSGSTDADCDEANMSAHVMFYEQTIANECGCR